VSSRGRTRGRPTRRPIIVLAGEDTNDRRVMRALIEAFCPDAKGRIVELNDCVRLCKAKDDDLGFRVKKLAGSVRARAVREAAEVRCVFVHEDFDAIDSPRCDSARERVQAALDRELGHAHYVLATWEMEAWLLLFPDALTAHVSTWKVPARYKGIDTGRVSDPKRVLSEEVSKAGHKYRESDSPKVVEKAVSLGLHIAPTGTNRSYLRFRQGSMACCKATSPR
jgi:hypothetical protein